jgi:hypothetical protein
MKTCILSSVTFFRKSCRLWDNVEKYCEAREAAGNITHALCMLGTQGCTRERTRQNAHALTEICNTTFAQQRWFREGSSVLRYTYIPCLVLHVFMSYVLQPSEGHTVYHILTFCQSHISVSVDCLLHTCAYKLGCRILENISVIVSPMQMGWACGTYRRQKRCIPTFCGTYWGKEPIWKN